MKSKLGDRVFVGVLVIGAVAGAVIGFSGAGCGGAIVGVLIGGLIGLYAGFLLGGFLSDEGCWGGCLAIVVLLLAVIALAALIQALWGVGKP